MLIMVIITTTMKYCNWKWLNTSSSNILWLKYIDPIEWSQIITDIPNNILGLIIFFIGSLLLLDINQFMYILYFVIFNTNFTQIPIEM